MRNIIYIILFSCLAVACEEAELKPYSGRDTIQFHTTDYDKSIVHPYYWAAALDPNALYDTCWIPVQTVGHASSINRQLKLVQDTARGVDFIYDLVGNVVDSVSYIIPDQAVAGKHYVSFESTEIQSLLIMPANTYNVNIPVVMKRSPSNTKKQTLKIRLVDTKDVVVGDPRYTTCTITIE